MSKALGTAAAIIGGVALIATGVGAIAGTTLIVAGTTTVGTIATVATTAAAVLSTASVLTAKRPSNDRQGSQLSFKIDPGAAIPYVIGRTAVGGTVVHRDTRGKDNHYQTFMVVLGGGGPYEAIEAQLADRVVVPYSGTAATGYYGNWMWSDRQVGLTPELDALRDGVVGNPYGNTGTLPGWGSAYKLSGYAAVSWTMLFDTKARRYSNGTPAPTWIVRGAKVYDPRADSTYPGGSGPCRWADPSDTTAHAAARATWVYSETPALHSLMWKLGVWQRNEADSNARYRKLMGVGAPIELIDVAAHVASANVQEANGWKVGGELDSAMGRWEAVKLIEQSGGAEPVANGALLSTMQKAPRVSLATITAADLADGRLVVPGGRARRDRINGFRARFRSEAHGWEIVPIKLVQIDGYVEADGGEKSASGDYALVQNENQAAQLAAYEIYDSRELQPITLPLKPKWMGYRIGDGLLLDLPEHGLPQQPVLVRARSIDPSTGIVTLTLATETAGKHAEALGMTGVAVPVPTLTSPPDSVPAPLAESWTLVAGMLDSSGVSVPVLLITGLVDNTNADAVLFEFREVGATEWSVAGLEPPDATRREIRGVVAERIYEAAVRYRARGIMGDRLVLSPVAVGQQVIAWEGVVGPGRPADNATVGAPAGTNVGGVVQPDGSVVGGLPAEQVPPALARITPIGDAVDLLKRADLDQEAAQRQATRDTAVLQTALMRLVLEADRTRAVMRDAGIVVDPATGTVRLYAVDQVTERTAKVEIALDAAKAQIALAATVNFVNEQIAKAQLDPTGEAALDEIIARITSTEVRLDGAEATIELKADATTLMQLSGTVTSVEQQLDALAGVVSTKAEQTTVDLLATRVGSAEQLLYSLPDVSGFSVTIRQARLTADDAATASLRALLAGDDANRRQITAQAEARQELYATIKDGLSAEAAQRTLLSVRIGAAEAKAASETLARISGDSALAQQIGALSVTVGQQGQALTAEVARLDQAIASGDNATAQSIAQVSARLNNFGGVTVEQAFSATVNRLGKVEGRYSVVIDANGNLQGFQLIGSDAGPASLNLINTDLRMGTGRVVFNNGLYMRIQGVGFGANGDLLSWFGPTMAIPQCTRANAISFEAVDGEAHYQTVTAGTLSNRSGSSGLAANEVALMGPFGSNGGQVRYVASWSYRQESTRNYPATVEGAQQFETDRATYGATDADGDGEFIGALTAERPASTVVLERTFDGATWTEVGRRSFMTERRTMRGVPPTVGDAPGSATFTFAIGGGFTVNDPTLSITDRQLRLVLARSFTFSGTASQRLSIVSTED